MRLSQLLAGLDVSCSGGTGDPDVTGVTHDSRQVREGFLFAAFRGQRHDGAAFIAQAIAAGAGAILVRRGSPVPTSIRCVFADDERHAAARIAARLCGDPSRSLVMVGITGTSGKTTTALLVERLLTDAIGPSGLFGTLWYRGPGIPPVEADRTTPEATELQPRLLALARAGGVAAVMECSSHALALERLGGCRYDVAVFTNLSRDHLDYHETFEAYFEAKARLFDLLKDGGKAVVNVDDPFGARLAARLSGSLGASRLVTTTLRGATDARVRARATTRPDGTLIEVEQPAALAIESPLIGAPNAENLLAAAAVGVALGIPCERIRASLASVTAIPGRLERVPNDRGVVVLVDYAHKPAALDGVLRTARGLARPGGRVVAVFGCGGDRDAGKRPEMGAIAARGADVVILTSDNPRSEDPRAILAAIDAGVSGSGGRATIEPDRSAAIERAARVARAGDVVVIAGKGHEPYQEIAGRKHPFDDRLVARAAFAAGATEATA